MIDLTGAICFSYPKDPSILSRAITKVSDSDYSHTFIGAPAYIGQPMIVEATFSGIEVTPWKHYKKGFDLAVFMPKGVPSEEILTSLEKVAATHLDLPYGFMTLIEIGFSYLLRFIGIGWIPPRSKNLVCSQLVLLFLRGIQSIDTEIKNLDMRLVSPRDLFQKLEKSPFFAKVVVPSL